MTLDQGLAFGLIGGEEFARDGAFSPPSRADRFPAAAGKRHRGARHGRFRGAPILPAICSWFSVGFVIMTTSPSTSSQSLSCAMDDRVRRHHGLTVSEFDRFVDAQRDESDWELVDGGVRRCRASACPGRARPRRAAPASRPGSCGSRQHPRGPKLSFYKSLPTLRHIVLAYQDQMRVEHDRREGAAMRRAPRRDQPPTIGRRTGTSK
jgi:hypothetical protein